MRAVVGQVFIQAIHGSKRHHIFIRGTALPSVGHGTESRFEDSLLHMRERGNGERGEGCEGFRVIG